jgi:asparagine synthase (glutamine-hydrolysing)
VKVADHHVITNILTLRYNPARQPKRRLSAIDFRPMDTHFESAKARVIDIIKRDLARLRVKDVSLLLSGGVDSILTVTMLYKIRPDIRVSCVSMGFADAADEVECAQKIACKFGCEFEAVVRSNVLSELPELIGMVKEPRWNLYQYYALKAARSKSRTIFSGDGGDELFGGYTFRYKKYLATLPARSSWKERARLYLSCHERDWVPDQENVFGPNAPFSWNKVYSLLRKHFDNELAPLDQVFLADYDGKLLYDWIPTNAVFAKALDAKILSLFLTTRMTNFATHMPWQLKYCPETATGKLLLRSILKEQGMTIEPIKKGFSIDTAALWDRNAREIAECYVNSDSHVVRAGIISSEWIEKTYARLKTELDVRYVNKMLGILALEVWWRLFVSCSMKNSEKL